MSFSTNAIKRPLTTTMLFIAVLALGVISLDRLKVDLMPELDFPMVMLSYSYAGVGPKEAESSVGKIVEQAIASVANVEKITTTCSEGSVMLLVEFTWGTDLDEAMSDIRERLDMFKKFLPSDLDSPLMLRLDPSLIPIMYLSIQGPDRKELTSFAEDKLVPALERIDDVAYAATKGADSDVVSVNLSLDRLLAYGISVDRVQGLLAANNLDLAGGRIEHGGKEFLLRTEGQFHDINDLKRIVVRQSKGKAIHLSDVAKVKLSPRETHSYFRINGKRGVAVFIQKQTGANTVQTTRKIREVVKKFREDLPKGINDIRILMDQSQFIQMAINNVAGSAVIGGLIAVMVIYFFLRSFGTTLVVSVAMPLSIVATFILLYFAGLTINFFSLGGLALGVGMLVDNAVVVIENIYRKRQEGMDMVRAADEGVNEVGMAITASTLTTVVVFLPVLFVTGIAREMFEDQALTVVFSLLASLAIALTLVPVLASNISAIILLSTLGVGVASAIVLNMLRANALIALKMTLSSSAYAIAGPLSGVLVVLAVILLAAGTLLFLLNQHRRGNLQVKSGDEFVRRSRFFRGLNDGYDRLIRWAVSNRKKTIGITALVTVFSLVLFKTSIQTEFFPQAAQPDFIFKIKLAPGTPVETTDAAVRGIDKWFRNAFPEVRMTMVEVGVDEEGTSGPMATNVGSNEAVYRVRIEDSDRLPKGMIRHTADYMQKKIRKFVQSEMPGVELDFNSDMGAAMLGMGGVEVKVEIQGPDLELAGILADDVKAQMKRIGGIDDVAVSLNKGKLEMVVRPDRDRCAALGLNTSTVARTVQTLMKGSLSTRYKKHGKEYDVIVRLKNSDRGKIEDIRRLLIGTPAGRLVRLDSIADIHEDLGPTKIQRVNQERYVSVAGKLAKDAMMRKGKIEAQVNRYVKKAQKDLPAGFEMHISGEAKDRADSFRQMGFAFLLAILLVYMVMASQFESLWHPFIVMFSMPLAIIGVIFALAITGTMFSILAFIGVIMLAGIVVNNAIVLVDFINRLRAQGMELTEAVVKAGKIRLRPILMTSLTTILALTPMAIGLGSGNEMRTPMARTVMGGLLTSTFLTLVFIPVIYIVGEKMKARRIDKFKNHD